MLNKLLGFTCFICMNFVIVKCWTIIDRNSEEKNEAFKKLRASEHRDNFGAFNKFHVDPKIEGQHRTVIFVDCFDIDIGPLAKRSLRFLFELAHINWTIESRATSPKYEGKPMTKRMAEFLRDRYQDLRGHRVKIISDEDFRTADFMLAIDPTTLEYINKIKPADSKAQIELWNDYDFYLDGKQDLLDVNSLVDHDAFLQSYWHNLRLSLMFLSNNIRCKKCYPIDWKVSEDYWDKMQ